MRSKIWNVILKIPLPVLSYLVAIAMIWGISILGGILCGTALFVYGIVVQYSEATFASGFLWFFCPMFFLWNTMYYIKTCYDKLIRTPKESSLKEKLATVLLGAIIFLLPSWYLGGRWTCTSVGQFLEQRPISAYQWGEKFFNIQSYHDATKNFKKAIFLDKYIVFWNDNSQLPIYYRELGRSLMNESDYSGMNKSLETSIEAYEKYRPDDVEGAAFVHHIAAMSCSLIGKEQEELNHSQTAYDYYSSQPRGYADFDTSMIGIWLAHCYYEKGDYAAAGRLFDVNIPIYYETIDWGVGDQFNAQLLALAYRFALLSYEKLGDTENIELYQKKYSQFIYLRDIQDAELDNLGSQLGWDK